MFMAKLSARSSPEANVRAAGRAARRSADVRWKRGETIRLGVCFVLLLKKRRETADVSHGVTWIFVVIFQKSSWPPKIFTEICYRNLNNFRWIFVYKAKTQAVDASKRMIELFCVFSSGGVEGARVALKAAGFRLTA
jgi:hypothetical protein